MRRNGARSRAPQWGDHGRQREGLLRRFRYEDREAPFFVEERDGRRLEGDGLAGPAARRGIEITETP